MNEASSFLESIRHVRIYIEYAYAYDSEGFVFSTQVFV